MSTSTRAGSTPAASEASYRGASPDAIRHHYDVGNEFFALWLDPTRTYSCALWSGDSEGDTLERAQERKLDYIAELSGAPGAGRVLDIGCGWGGMLRRLLEHHGVEQVVGLTLSQAQADHARAQASERCEVRVENWADHVPDAPYDAIVSVGAFEHFADYGMTRSERVDAYRRFFQCCREWLPKGGRLALQTNVKGSNVRLDRDMLSDFLFVIEHIFPESELPWPSEILEASERRFECVSMRNDPHHYSRTCRMWLESLVANRVQVRELVGEKLLTDYERYLRASAEAFDRKHLGLLRIGFERV